MYQQNALADLVVSQNVQTPEDILNAKRLIFPGVGAFAAMMDVLNQNGMAEAIRTYVENDPPFLGICLGLQLLFESSTENRHMSGLGLIPGLVGRFDSSDGCRVPRIGWNALQIEKDSVILDDIANRHEYFVILTVPFRQKKMKNGFHPDATMGFTSYHPLEGEMYMLFNFTPEKSALKLN